MLAHKLFETFDRECEMRATLVADDSVNLVKDECARGFEHPATAFTGQEDVERFGSRDDDVRGTLRHRGSLGGWCVAGANECANVNFRQSERFQFFLNSFERDLEISLHVVAE